VSAAVPVTPARGWYGGHDTDGTGTRGPVGWGAAVVGGVVVDVVVVAVVGGKVWGVGRRECHWYAVVGTGVVTESVSRCGEPHPASSVQATTIAPRRNAREVMVVATHAEV
jgi:hypothetical protein